MNNADAHPAILGNSTYVGIDFGTSTTVISIASFDSASGLPVTKVLNLSQRLPDGATMSAEKLPTVIALHGDRLLVGQGASDLKYKLKKGRDVWYSFKMELGEDLADKYYESVLGHDNPSGRVLTRPKDAARIFFEYVKKQIQAEIQKTGLPEYIQYAVSIPASFEANQRKELIEALAANDMQLNRQALIDEPNAAFLSYVRQTEVDGSSLSIPDNFNANVLVFDFGAGTCDVSILEIGQGARGLYSRNLAISEFRKLGGDDIDRYIATNYLLPQLLEANGLDAKDFRSREVNEQLLPALLKAAEQLKINISNLVSMQSVERLLPGMATSDERQKLSQPIRVSTRKGNLELVNPQLSYKQFSEVMNVFLKIRHTITVANDSSNDPFISIFNPIQSALRKANLSKDEIDHVLFIGGSAQNPYVQDALKSYFTDADLLIPQDLQTHVSQGAALHSLMYNGINTNVIQPITSEPIILITKDESPRILIPAGESVPTQPVMINDLITDAKQQEAIELPICIGSVNKMLFNIRISRPEGFASGTPVELSLELNSDKLLLVRASAAGKTVFAEPMSPFANRELTTQERVIIRAERQLNLIAAKQAGKPTKEALIGLYNAYTEADRHLLAAETLEQVIELYPDSSQYNQIGVAYGNAGRWEKAMEFYERAYASYPTNQTIVFNLAYSLRDLDKERSMTLLEKSHKIDPNNPLTLFELGRKKRAKGDDGYNELFQQAFDIYHEKYEQQNLRRFEYGWFASLASEMGKHSLAREIRDNQKDSQLASLFDTDNLTRTRSSDNLLDSAF